MRSLQAAIVIRCFEVLGVCAGSERLDIRMKSFVVNDSPKIYSAKAELSADKKVVLLYFESDNAKYMIAGNEGAVWYCFVSADMEDEWVELNKAYCSLPTKEGTKFRGVSGVEASSVLNGFELIDSHVPSLLPESINIDNIKLMKEFVASMDIG